MITLLRASETALGHTVRAWTGPATDEGVGLIAMLEIADPSGRPVCRFEVFLPTTTQHTNPHWPKDDHTAAQHLQDHAIEQARTAILASALSDLHGHRYDLT